MRLKRIFSNNIYSIFSILISIISIIFFIIIKLNLDHIVTNNPNVYNEANSLLFIIGTFILIIALVILGFIYIIRRSTVKFSNSMCDSIDKIIYKEEKIEFVEDEETIFSKLQHKLKKLVEILDNNREEALREKDNIKSLIGDISHQIKTPIANITMYNDTLIQRELNKDQQNMFLNNMKFQVSKLEWLVQALIKMSRLESNIISLNKVNSTLSDTIANALSGVYLKAEEKEIDLTIECPAFIKVNHDKKWTSEALFNIIENAVKYTDNGGSINIFVEEWELFTKIDIMDTGIGISEEDINNIFKRFYRCREVLEVEGIGIGLYLTNEIITKQGGYIKVKSEKGKGTTFSVFLQR
ncbi:MAG: HAMP domain-containing sensor histidine kinase [Clostridium sp.]|nr:HAMP domain-containing sensor histidine kinase [Clostridium sp.]